MSHNWAKSSPLFVVVMRQLHLNDLEVVTAVVEVPADLKSAQIDYPYRVVEVVKEKFCGEFPEFRNARWWFVTAPQLSITYDELPAVD